MKKKDLVQGKLEALYLSGEREVPLLGLKKPKKIAPPQEEAASGEESPLKAESKPSIQTPQPRHPPEENPGLLKSVQAEIGDCARCRLSKERKNIVFGVGNPQAKLMFVGEAPGRDEDIQGEPFVGRAGQLLTKIIEAMKFQRSDIYIANIIKCRPPENRNPAPDEIATCEPFLLRQIEIIRPQVIVCLGTFAAQTLLQTEAKITGLRGHFHPWPSARVKESFATTLQEGSIQVMPTYHPAFLLRNPNMKRPVWEDMQKVMTLLNASG